MAAQEAAVLNQFVYPEARRGDLTREYENSKGHTVVIPEPYDWLEDPDNEETKVWAEAQTELFNGYIEGSPVTEEVSGLMTEMMNFERYTCPYRIGNRYFWRYNTGLLDHYIVYTSDNMQNAEPRELLNPNEWSEDKTWALSGSFYSYDGENLAYGIAKSGSDWKTIEFVNVGTGEKFSDVLEYCKFTTVDWTHDNQGVFYNRYPAKENTELGTETDQSTNQHLYYHKLGTDQSEDVLLFSAEDIGDASWMLGVEVSECGRWLYITISDSCDPQNRAYFLDLQNFDCENPLACWNGSALESLNKVVDTFDEGEYSYLGNDDTLFYFKTNFEAPNNKIITMDISVGASSRSDLIGETDNVLESAQFSDGNKLLLTYMIDVTNQLMVYEINEGVATLNDGITFDFEPASLTCWSSRRYTDLFVLESSFLVASRIYYSPNINAPGLQVFKEAVVPGFDASAFTAKQIKYQSKDGTSIPMFILHGKDMEMNGENPTLLYGYGGFNISITPYFSVSRVLWAKIFQGPVCIANLRGGGEYGDEWHKAGCLDQKQNVFDDFISAGEYLIDQGYTNSDKLVIEGGSNGGLLVGACCNQRPDLFACGLAHVGVMDMLRFHKFTIGYAWCSDYGCADKPEEFDALYDYSPLHNIPKMKEGLTYPSFLGLTADHDDRVVPLHTEKFMAELQRKVGRNSWQVNPLLSRIEMKAGHGAGKSLTKQIAEVAEKLAFVAKAIKL